jgi:hypothetical protein
MKNFKIFSGISTLLTLMTLSLFPFQAPAEQDWDENETAQVARIAHIEGRLDRYDPETDEWVATMADAPVGINDQLYSGAGTKAEILMPNDTVMRMGAETHLRIVALSDQLTEIDLITGTARLYNNAAADAVTTTPYGLVSAPAGAAFDLSVDDRSVRIIAIRDSVEFSHYASGARKMIMAGATAVMADNRSVSTIAGTVDRDWDDWNRAQEALWADRNRRSGESATYLPEPLHHDAYVLDTHGTWQSVYYEGAFYRCWRPLHVGASWAPFTVGAWSVWRGDRVWVPHEPFGYVTHHYGNWIYTRGSWYWAPPVTRVMIHAGLPLLHIGFGWYPGRVAWISTGLQVSWIPLAPREPYYCHYPWGRRAIVVAKGAPPRHHAPQHLIHRRHAVKVHRDRAFAPEKRRHAHHRIPPARPGIRPSPPRPLDSPKRPEFPASRPRHERIAPEPRKDNHRPKPVVKPAAPPLRNDVRPKERVHPSRPVAAPPPSAIHPVKKVDRDKDSRFTPTAPERRRPAAPSRDHDINIENKPEPRVVPADQKRIRTNTVNPHQQRLNRVPRQTHSREAVNRTRPDRVEKPARRLKPDDQQKRIQRR